jgi:hypothetical protein
MHSQRIQGTDTMATAVFKLSEGNPGAVAVMTDLIKEGGKIDPDSFLPGMGCVLDLDRIGLYGSHIYILHNDICERKLNKTVAVLRACQLGFLSESVLRDACSREDRSGKKLVPVEDLYAKVKEMLPNFDKQ